jgi:hypothetical protein
MKENHVLPYDGEAVLFHDAGAGLDWAATHACVPEMVAIHRTRFSDCVQSYYNHDTGALSPHRHPHHGVPMAAQDTGGAAMKATRSKIRRQFVYLDADTIAYLGQMTEHGKWPSLGALLRSLIETSVEDDRQANGA